MSYTTQIPSPDGTVTTFAGSSSGYSDGTGTSAQFNFPIGVAVDVSGNVYVADAFNAKVRKITPSKVVSTLANVPATVLTVDLSGNVYVTGGLRVRKITPGGVVTILAGSGNSAYVNGPGTSASFQSEFGIGVSSTGIVYVADNGVRKITPEGVVSTFASGGNPDTWALAVDSSDNVYVTNRYNLILNKYNPAGQLVLTVNQNLGFRLMVGVAVNQDGVIFISEQTRISKLSFTGNTPTRITVAGDSIGYLDGIGTNAQFDGSGYAIGGSIGIDLAGNVYVGDSSNQRIRKVAIIADPNTFSDAPLTGTLLTSFNPALEGSIIKIPPSTTNQKVAVFTLPVSSLPLKTSVTGIWSLVLYATVGLSTSPASFYFQVVDGATTVATGATVTSVNQSSPMQLYKSNLSIPARTYTTDLTLNIYATTQPSSILTLGFNGSTISYINTTIPTVGLTGPTGSDATGRIVTLSTYTGTVIRNAVAANNSSITTVWSNALPSTAKGRAGTLGMFFNMYSLTQFASNTSFDYGVYIDGSSISYGESNTSRYVQTTTSTYAFSSNGFVLGVGGMTPYQPISFPLYIPPQANALTIGIANASVPFSPVQSVALAYLSNVLTSSGTSNTSNFIPQNTFTSTGQFTYTVPSLCSAGAVTGVFIYLWGSGGTFQHFPEGWGNSGGAGGGGGFVSGYYGCSPGTVLSYIVGFGGGNLGLSGLGRVGTIASGGGSGDAGGFSGVFLSNAAISNTIGIAGGGGGAAYSTGYGGAGGYPSGSSGYNFVGGSGVGVPSPATGGTQTSPGTGTGNSFLTAASQFFGANGNQACGGGGWYGGGQGSFGAGQGGGGGSSYIGNVNGASGGIGMAGATTANGITLSNVSMTPGSNALPGGTTSQFYQSGRGHGAGGHGLVVIVPAVGTNPVYMGVNAKMLAV
jgi:hypothetical protein